jgi:hypothetical protein
MGRAVYRSLLFMERLGIRAELEKSQQKYPGRVERNVGNVVGRSSVKYASGHTYEEPASIKLNGSVMMHWVYAGENYPGRRIGRCNHGIGRDLEYENCGSFLDLLTGRFKYYSCQSWEVSWACDISAIGGMGMITGKLG